jgi:hypothetical protein
LTLARGMVHLETSITATCFNLASDFGSTSTLHRQVCINLGGELMMIFQWSKAVWKLMVHN